MDISKRIFELRKKSGMSQEELANSCDVSRQAVSKWESGQAMPDIEKVVRICEVFEVSTDFLIKGEIIGKSGSGEKGKGRLGCLLMCASAVIFFVLLIIGSVLMYIISVFLSCKFMKR